MYSPTDLKKGTVIQIDGQPYRVMEYNQKVMGRGGSIVNVKIKNLVTGAMLPKTYKGQEKVESADVSTRKVQYLYADGADFYLMDPESFDQFQVDAETMNDADKYLHEGDEVGLQFFGEKVINVELPTNVTLEVTYAENVVKGDTTSSVLKDATCDTGLVVKVPAFIKTGDKIKVDTRDGSYVERQK